MQKFKKFEILLREKGTENWYHYIYTGSYTFQSDEKIIAHVERLHCWLKSEKIEMKIVRV